MGRKYNLWLFFLQNLICSCMTWRHEGLWERVFHFFLFIRLHMNYQELLNMALRFDWFLDFLQDTRHGSLCFTLSQPPGLAHRRGLAPAIKQIGLGSGGFIKSMTLPLCLKFLIRARALIWAFPCYFFQFVHSFNKYFSGIYYEPNPALSTGFSVVKIADKIASTVELTFSKGRQRRKQTTNTCSMLLELPM